MKKPHVGFMAFAALISATACYQTPPPRATSILDTLASEDYSGDVEKPKANGNGDTNKAPVQNNNSKGVVIDPVVDPNDEDNDNEPGPITGGGGGGGVFPGPRPLPNDDDDEFTFTNPVVPGKADPSVVQRDGFYYYCFAQDGIFFVSRSRRLQDIGEANAVQVFEMPADEPFSKNVIVPQLQFVQDRWYIYFSANDGAFENQRTFVLEGDTEDPQEDFILKGQIAAFTDRMALNSSVMEIDGELFFLWSGADNTRIDQQNIYIAPMLTPFSLDRNPEFVQRVEAEAATVVDAQVLGDAASGGAKVGFIDLATSSVEFVVNAPRQGSFALDIGYSRGLAGTTSHQLSVNGRVVETVLYPFNDDFSRFQTVTRRVTLRAGRNTIKLQKGEGAAELDYIEVKTPNVDRVAIATPEEEFERIGGAPFVNEAPIALQRDGRTFIVFSVNGAASEDRSLAMLELVGNDPMSRDSWVKTGPVFTKTTEVFGPSNAVFVKSPDETEDWMVYHHQRFQGSGFERDISIQPFEFDRDGFPDFGSPVDPFERILVPSE